MKTLMKSAVISLAASVLAVSGVVLADPGVQWPSFSQLDKNKDGAIDKNEAKAVTSLNFDTADANHDGKISQDEYKAAMLQQGQEGGMGGSAPDTRTH